MSKRVRRPRVSKNQHKILEILERYEELTAKDIAEILWARDIRYQTPEYSSVHRSLTALYKRGLLEKVGGQLMWRKARKKPEKEIVVKKVAMISCANCYGMMPKTASFCPHCGSRREG